MTDLQRAVNALEEAGFHVERAYEQRYLDLGIHDYANKKTGIFCLQASLWNPNEEDILRKNGFKG
jgi:hypothetical protein